jgi:TetR/AcrR family transcriptional regulator, tetracycline repressor protein
MVELAGLEVHDPGGQEPRPRLTLDQVVQAAVALLDEEGLDGLTTRALATRLGVQSPAIYWYVRDKGELLDLVADAICAPALEPDEGGDLGWREQAAIGLCRYRDVLRSHRDAPRLLAERPPNGPVRRRLADLAVGQVLRAGFPEADAAVISLLLGDCVISIVSEEFRIEEQAARSAAEGEIPWQGSAEYPNLARIAAHLAAVKPDDLFQAGLDVLLDGLEQRLARLRAALPTDLPSMVYTLMWRTRLTWRRRWGHGHPPRRRERMMAGHSRWKTLQAKRLAETGDIVEHPEYEQAGRDLRLGDQLRAIRRSRNLTQKEVAERAGISQPALSRIELGGGVPDIETLRRLGNAMGVRFHVIVGDEDAEHEENLLLTCKEVLPPAPDLK